MFMVVLMLMIAVMVFMFVMMVAVLMLTVMQSLPRPRAAGVLTEHQRFDRDRHSVGGHADSA